MPNNFQYLDLVQLILPNAKIIDVRREPLACGFSIFKQLFANGQRFAYSLEDIGRYYRMYVGPHGALGACVARENPARAIRGPRQRPRAERAPHTRFLRTRIRAGLR
jgi:hypothetical protein